MKKFILDILFIIILSYALTFATGCGKDEAVILPERESIHSVESGNTNDTDDTANPGAGYKETGSVHADSRADKSGDDISGGAMTEAGASEGSGSERKSQDVTVYVCGAVVFPGVYTLDDGKRIADAISLAGGMTDEADRDYINQAMVIYDCQKIYVPRQGEIVNAAYDDGSAGILPSDITGASGAEPGRNGSSKAGTDEDPCGRVNINTGSAQELMTLPGIGEAKAKLIIEYRDSYGGFSSIEDIMKISGIKEGMFNKIKDRICI